MKRIKKLPMEMFLVQCDCSEENRIGFLYPTEKSANKGLCKTAVVSKVKISKIK